MSATITPCPFCGGSELVSGVTLTYCGDGEGGGKRYSQPSCKSCGAVGPHAYFDGDEIDEDDAERIAIDAWNNRSAAAIGRSKEE